MTDLPESKRLILEQDDGWLRIWFNRPDTRNALSDDLVRDLKTLLDAVAADSSIRGITLRGKGDVFCAGGDLKAFKSVFQGEDVDIAGIKAASRVAGQLFAQLNSMPQVVLVLVDGAAMAGGFGIVCTGDIVAVTKNARFALTETTLGIPPAQIAPYVLRRLGMTTARRLMLTAARFDGTEAGNMGLADFVVENASGLDDVESAIREQVLKCAPGANGITKELLLATTNLSDAQFVEKAADAFAQCIMGDEGREGVSAFLGKRKPSWAE